MNALIYFESYYLAKIITILYLLISFILLKIEQMHFTVKYAIKYRLKKTYFQMYYKQVNIIKLFELKIIISLNFNEYILWIFLMMFAYY